jgi:hypothetical protein
MVVCKSAPGPKVAAEARPGRPPPPNAPPNICSNISDAAAPPARPPPNRSSNPPNPAPPKDELARAYASSLKPGCWAAAPYLSNAERFFSSPNVCEGAFDQPLLVHHVFGQSDSRRKLPEFLRIWLLQSLLCWCRDGTSLQAVRKKVRILALRPSPKSLVTDLVVGLLDFRSRGRLVHSENLIRIP